MAQLSVRIFAETDLEGYLELSQSEYGTTVASDAQHIRWKHLDSQFGASLYINLAEADQVVGRALMHARSLRTPSKLFSAGQVMDLLIDKGHRKTPTNFLNITKECGKIEEFDFVFHTSNERSFPLYSKLFRFPNPFSLKAYGFPVRLSGVLASILGRRINAIDWLVAPLHWLLEVIAYATKTMARLEISGRAMGDEELEVLCTRCLDASGSHLSRTNAFLKWRFGDAPLWPADVWRIDRKGKLTGYVVTRKVELGGLTHLVLMDFILDPATPLLTRFALRLWLVRQAVKSKADSLFTMANPSSIIARTCVGFPFVSIPDSLLPHATPIFMRARTPDSRELEADQSIHMTLADLDYF